MSRAFIHYWKPKNVDDNLRENPRLDHDFSDHFGKVKPGDDVWIFTCRRGRLYTLGRIPVDRVVGPAAAQRVLRYEGGVGDCPYHVLGAPAAVQPMEQVDITKWARELRFVGAVDQLPRRFSGSNFQSMRQLTPDSARLLERVYSEQLPRALEEIDTGDLSPEGKRTLMEHYRSERSPKNRRRFLDLHDGAYVCEVCGMDFASVYGPQAATYIQVHHRVPVSNGSRTPKASEFAMVCANCHAMLHWKRGAKPLAVEALRRIVRRQAARLTKRLTATG